MFAIRIKGTQDFVVRKPYRRVSITETSTYKSRGAAQIAITASKSPFPGWNLESLGISSFDELEVVELEIKVKGE